MRPLFRSLFILSVFGLLSAHVSRGVLRDFFDGETPALLGLLDQWLGTLLVDPLGRPMAVNVLLGTGGVLALVAFIMSSTGGSQGSTQRHSTW